MCAYIGRPIMVAASLTALLWRRASASSSSFAPQSSLAAAAGRSPAFCNTSRRLGTVPALLAFQPISSRRPLATAFSNDPASRFAARTLSTSTYLKSTSQVEGAPPDAAKQRKPIPTILLAGFLGSGKTTTLKHLLENNSNIKIGTIVNDVASVNIDAKLIANSDSRTDVEFGGAEGVVELQNGCACCSLADELFTSVVRLTQNGERELDAIVVELSGVADPVAVRDNWKQAELMGHPATRLASLRRTVTLVDACTFGTDWMTWDAAMEREGWTAPGDDCTGLRKVPELLAEQVEAADLLVINKVDLAGEKQVGVASGLAKGMNDKAELREVEFGKVGARELLGEVLDEEAKEAEAAAHSHEHSHNHEASAGHDHGHEASACTDPDCTDESHSHSHKHTAECDDPTCTDTSHSHSHEHTADCSDPDCTDTSHSHSHDHSAAADHSTTAADQLGITSFVYKCSTPFNSERLLALLNRWPVPIKDSLDFGLLMGMGQEGKIGESTPEENKMFVGVLRSKGFCWMAPTKWSTGSGATGGDAWRHDTAMYWSHAGKHFGISSAGKWWGSLSKEQMKPYFANNIGEYDRIMREDWISEEWGDRRQELVFIGANLDEAEIRAALDACLCTAEEMEVYRAQLRNYIDATFSKAADGPSLFDVGGTDHIEQN